MKKIDFKKMGVNATVVVMTSIALSFIFANRVNEHDTNLVTGHFNRIEKEIARGSVSYDLYVSEREDFYKIAADNARCFAYDQFNDDIRKGRQIQFYVQNSIIRVPIVVCLVANHRAYLSFDCTNGQMEDDRIKIPLALLAITILISCAIYKKELKVCVKQQQQQ